MALIQNPKSVESVPNVELWDLHTNKISKISKKRYDILLQSSGSIAIGNAPAPFFRRFYVLDDFKGQKIAMYHLKSLTKVDVMTLPLFQEIQRRNPVEQIPVYDNGVKIKNSSSVWEKYLATDDEVRNAPSNDVKESNVDISAIVAREVAKALEGTKPVRDESSETVSEAPKRGRRKKSETIIE